ncbi:MAG: hypothetical protein ACXVC0_01730 [Bdellovibrionota bacterium]
MRALILFFLAVPSFAKPVVLTVDVKLHHSRQRTQVFEEKDGWYCVTENNPRYPLMGKPAFLALMKNESSTTAACRETFTARMDKKVWKGCKADASEFLRALGKECGRF